MQPYVVHEGRVLTAEEARDWGLLGVAATLVKLAVRVMTIPVTVPVKIVSTIANGKKENEEQIDWD